MPIDRPKLLSVITVPSGGWDLTINYSSTEAGQYLEVVTATMPAGDYFMSWDGQTDDFLWALANAINEALDTDSPPDWVDRTEGVAFWVDSDHYVHLAFVGTWFAIADHRDVQIDWTADDGASIGNVLGFKTGTALSLAGEDNPSTLAPRQHAYGWYADTDGELEHLGIEPDDQPDFAQSFAPSGHSKTQYLGSKFENELRLGFIPRLKMKSRDVGYTEEPVSPYYYNVPLECWWQEARQGKRFRVYRDSVIDTTKANESLVPTADTATTLTATGESFLATIHEHGGPWVGRLLVVPKYGVASIGGAIDVPMRFHIASHDSTVLTVSQQQEPQRDVANSETDVCHIYDQRYETYVVDLQSTGGFAPDEIPDIDKFNIRISLVRYEA